MQSWAFGRTTITFLSLLFPAPLLAAPQAATGPTGVPAQSAPTQPIPVPLTQPQPVPAPAAPVGGQPAAPVGSQPAAPVGGQPAAPVGGQPAAPIGGQPAAPSAVQYYAIVPAPVAPDEPPKPASTVDPATIHNHDGFYLRLSIGGGYLWNHIEAKNSSDKLTVRGSIMPLEVLIGGTAVPGLAIGGGLWMNPGIQFKSEFGGTTTELQDDYDLMFVQFGPFVDYYLDPKQGFHLLGAVTISNFSLDYQNDFATTGSSIDATGFGFTLGVGQDFWIGKQWSAGVLGKFTYASLSETRDGLSFDHEVLSPSIVATFTLH